MDGKQTQKNERTKEKIYSSIFSNEIQYQIDEWKKSNECRTQKVNNKMTTKINK